MTELKNIVEGFNNRLNETEEKSINSKTGFWNSPISVMKIIRKRKTV